MSFTADRWSRKMGLLNDPLTQPSLDRDNCLGNFFCSSCVGKLTKIDLDRSFEIFNAISQFDCRFCISQVSRVLKNKA